MAEHAELLETAFVNLLTGQPDGTWQPDLKNKDAVLRIFAGESNLDKDGTTIVCLVDGDMGDEDPPCTGNRWCDFMVELKTSVSKNAQVALGAHQQNAAALQSVILSETLPEDIMGALEGLTVFGVIKRTPMREQTPQYWKSAWKARLYSCPTTFTD